MEEALHRVLRPLEKRGWVVTSQEGGEEDEEISVYLVQPWDGWALEMKITRAEDADRIEMIGEGWSREDYEEDDDG